MPASANRPAVVEVPVEEAGTPLTHPVGSRARAGEILGHAYATGRREQVVYAWRAKGGAA